MSRPTAIRLAALLALACERASGLPEVPDNAVDFAGVDSIGWRETLYSVSSGQPYRGVSVQNSTLHVHAGRRGAPHTAAAFCRGLEGANMLGLGAAAAARPERLNFVSFGTLTVQEEGNTRTCENFHIGQGHRGVANNWWVGRKGCVLDGSTLTCEDCGVSIAPLPFYASSHRFLLALLPLATPPPTPHNLLPADRSHASTTSAPPPASTTPGTSVTAPLLPQHPEEAAKTLVLAYVKERLANHVQQCLSMLSSDAKYTITLFGTTEYNGLKEIGEYLKKEPANGDTFNPDMDTQVKDDDHILVKATGNKEGSWFKPIYAYFTIDVKANKIVEVNAGLNVR